MNMLSRITTLTTIMGTLTGLAHANPNLTVAITTNDPIDNLMIGNTVAVEVYADFDSAIDALYYEIDFDGSGEVEVTSRTLSSTVAGQMQLLSLIQQAPLFIDSLPYNSRSGTLPVTLVDQACDGTPGVTMIGLSPGSGILIETLVLTVLDGGQVTVTIQNPSAVTAATNPNGDLFVAQPDPLNDTLLLSGCGLTDCDMNGVGDDCDLLESPSLDCDGNGILDACDIAALTHPDCNQNSVPDSCDLAWGYSDDTDSNSIPDECDLDCDFDGVPDSQSTLAGSVADCNTNSVPDSCETRPGNPSTTVAEDFCVQAQAICPLASDTSGAVTYTGSTSVTSSDFSSSCNGGKDVFYRYTPAVDGYLTLDFCDSVSDVAVSIHNACDGSGELACVDDPQPGTCASGDLTSPVTAPLSVQGGTEYIIRVSSDGLDQPLGGSFNMIVTGPMCEPIGGDGDCNANGVPDECDISAGTSGDVNSNTIPDECDPDCNTNGQPDDQDIAVGTSNDCNGNLIPDECEISPSLSVAADDCENAQAVCTGNVYVGSTTGATPDGNDTCTFMSFNNDVWYTYTPATDGLLTASLCGSQFNTVVSIHQDYADAEFIDKACDQATSTTIACNDDSQTCEPPGTPIIYGESEVSVNVTEGDTYYIRVAGKGIDGDFSMALTGPACVGDCNNNSIPDECDVDPLAGGMSQDCNTNLIPDECEQGTVSCGQVRVPTDYATIQDAIDNSPPFTDILLEDGMHSGTGNHTIDFAGKPYVVRPENGLHAAAIDCGGAGSAFVFDNSETASAVIEGLIISNCTDSAIQIVLSDPTIRDCVINGNSAQNGGGVYIHGGNSLIDRCVIEGNNATNYGGGVYIKDTSLLQSTPTIRNTIILGNTAGTVSGGGGLHVLSSGQVSVINCTIVQNSGGALGGGISTANNGTTVVSNSILWGNTDNQYYDPLSKMTFSHCNVQGGAGGTNILNIDPRFVDESYGDFRLISVSPCIDVGDSTVSVGTLDLDSQGRITGNAVDIGADEFYTGALLANNYNLSLAAGGTVGFTLEAGVQFAGMTYVLAGSSSGTIPGTVAPSGLTVPLNPDAYTDLTLQAPANFFTAMTGTLDSTGRSTAPLISFQLGEITVPAGTVLHHAFSVLDNTGAIVFVSNAEPLTIDP